MRIQDTRGAGVECAEIHIGGQCRGGEYSTHERRLVFASSPWSHRRSLGLGESYRFDIQLISTRIGLIRLELIVDGCDMSMSIS